MNRVGVAAACGALLFLAACGAGAYSEAAQEAKPLTVRSTTTRPSEAHARADSRRVLDNGLVITLSAPKSFTPTDTAYPHAARAVAFELTIDNEGTDIYRPSQLAITATYNGEDAQQVIDSTQGYTGFVGATDEVPPGERVRISVAFAVPTQRAEVALIVQPDVLDGTRVTVFNGTV